MFQSIVAKSLLQWVLVLLGVAEVFVPVSDDVDREVVLQPRPATRPRSEVSSNHSFRDDRASGYARSAHSTARVTTGLACPAIEITTSASPAGTPAGTTALT